MVPRQPDKAQFCSSQTSKDFGNLPNTVKYSLADATFVAWLVMHIVPEIRIIQGEPCSDLWKWRLRMKSIEQSLLDETDAYERQIK